jgi:hypothetical protein
MRTKNDTARIKKMLTGPLGKRLNKANAEQIKVSAPVRIKESQKAIIKLLGTDIVKAPARREFAKILAADKVKKETLAKKMQMQAFKNSGPAQRTLNQIKAQRLKGLKGLLAQPINLPSTEYFLLSTPFLILPNQGLHLDDWEYVANNSFIKVRTDSDGYRQDSVRFYYLWTNPRNVYSVVSVDGFIIFNGYCFVGTDGGVWPEDRSSSTYVTGTLELYEWWVQPPIQPAPEVDASVQAVSLGVTSGGWFDVGAIDGRNVYRGYDLQYTGLAVPPNGTLVIAVTATLSNNNNGGGSYIDFSSKNYQIGSPFVTVALTS